MKEAHLSPRALAEAIGVSESSLKRWADEGRLRVERTAGGHRRIALADALEFLRKSGMRPVRPELLGIPELGGARGADLDEAAALLYEQLMEDRAPEARGLILSLFLEGHGVAAICDGPVRGALERVGHLWEQDERGVFIEHRATQTCYRALVELRLALPTREEGPLGVGGAHETDVYRVPSAMVALVLVEAGFQERDLGANTPIEALLAAVEHYRPRLIWQSYSVPPARPREVAAGLARLADAATDGVVVVGGREATSVTLPDRPNVHRLGSMGELSAFARGLIASSEGGAARIGVVRGGGGGAGAGAGNRKARSRIRGRDV